jgi:hypothetical protein
VTATGLQVTLDDVDVTCHAFAPMTISWGREHPGASFEPRVATISFDDIAAPRRGQHLVATLNDPAANQRWMDAHGTWAAATGTWSAARVDLVVFSGRITDTQASWDRLHVYGEAKPRWAAVLDVTAVDPLAELANQSVGDAPWPQETITQRATRIEALTPLAWLNDASAALVAARDVDLQPASELLDDLAHMGSLAGGLFYDPATSTARFMLDAQRNSIVPTITVDACAVGADARAVVDASDVVNDVTVSYVNPLDSNAQPTARSSSPTSISTYGRRQRTISTDLVSATDANQRAVAEAARFAAVIERWQDVKLGTAYGTTSKTLARALMSVGPAVRVRMTALPKPARGTWDGYVEGWALEVDADHWEVSLSLSPAVWSGPLVTWADVAVAQRWVDVARPFPWQEALSQVQPSLLEPLFENWTGDTTNPGLPNGYPLSWTIFWITGTRGTVKKGAPQGGASSLQWRASSGASQQRLISNSWPTQQGRTIQIGIWARSLDLTKPCSIQLDVMSAPYQDVAPFAPNTRNQTALAPTALTGAWVFYSGTVVVPAGHAFVTASPVLIAASPGGAVVEVDTAQSN